MLEKVAAEFTGKVVVGKVDVDDAIDVFERFGVMAMPTLLFLKNGEAVDQANFLNENAFRDRVKELLAS